ncbi:MAG: di-trans,poly-cis-decaprenylcistransferase [DPANN group archaeon]|nr:di-trans,poly-cis-decaprenylcistransferase [DPANN group archaeon]
MDKKDVPKHIGIIMDGNRRFAKKLMKEPWKGHEWGAKKVETVLDWARELDIKTITLYSFSIENIDRPKDEFDMLMNIFEKNFKRIKIHPKIHEYQVKINVIGRIELLPQKVQDAIAEAIESTKNYSNHTINFAIAYGGRQEIIDTTKNIAELVKAGKIKPEDIDDKLFSKYLYLTGYPDPELIIRTSGERRLSGFLLWQSAYSELYFSEKLWPEFQKEDFIDAIESFKTRQRRFGK